MTFFAHYSILILLQTFIFRQHLGCTMRRNLQLYLPLRTLPIYSDVAKNLSCVLWSYFSDHFIVISPLWVVQKTVFVSKVSNYWRKTWSCLEWHVSPPPRPDDRVINQMRKQLENNLHPTCAILEYKSIKRWNPGHLNHKLPAATRSAGKSMLGSFNFLDLLSRALLLAKR